MHLVMPVLVCLQQRTNKKNRSSSCSQPARQNGTNRKHKGVKLGGSLYRSPNFNAPRNGKERQQKKNKGQKLLKHNLCKVMKRHSQTFANTNPHNNN